MVSSKTPTLQWCAMHFTLHLQWYHILIILPANSITQLQNLWILYYIPTHYRSVLFRLLQYYRPGLIILTIK